MDSDFEIHRILLEGMQKCHTQLGEWLSRQRDGGEQKNSNLKGRGVSLGCGATGKWRLQIVEEREYVLF